MGGDCLHPRSAVEPMGGGCGNPGGPASTFAAGEALVDVALARWRTRGAVVGFAGLLLAVVGAFFSRVQFFESYLWAFLFWFSIAMGCLPLLMIYHLVGGSWGLTIRRILESGTRTLPL